MTKAYDLFVSLIPRLQRISVANGYLSEAGASVIKGQVPKNPGESYPYIRLHKATSLPETQLPHSPTAKVRVPFIAQAFMTEPVAENVQETGDALVGDMKKALFGDPFSDLNRTAIDARYEGDHVIYPTPGSDVLIAEVRGSYSFTDHFDNP